MWYTINHPPTTFFMNKHQALLQKYERALRDELLSDRSAADSVALFNNWKNRDTRDRLEIYDNALKNIGHMAGATEHFFGKMQEILNVIKDPVLHFCVITHSTYQPVEFLSVLDCVDVGILDKDLKSRAIGVLLRNQNDRVRASKNMTLLFNNYTLFKPFVRPHQKDIAFIAAENGHKDLLTCLNWSPRNPTQQKIFFTACCVGGLLDHIKQLNVSNSELLHNGMLGALINGHSQVAEYISSLPTVQWDKVDKFEALIYAKDSLFDTLLGHYKTHPKYPSIIRQTVYLSLVRNSGSFSKILEHTPMDGIESMVRIVVASRSKTNMKILLSHIGDQHFNKGLEDLEFKHVQWAQEYRTQLQQRVLKKAVKSAPTVVRKSKM